MAHRLRSFDVTMLVISLVIGIGIFRTPQLVAAQAGTVPLFALAWVLGAVFSMCGALTFARIGTLHPVTGGFYSIFSACYHPGFAFAMNWSLVVTNAASMAGVALIGAEYLAPVIIHGTVEKWHLDAIVVTTVLVLYLVNVGGLRMGARAQNLLSLLKVILILGLCAVVIVAPGNPQPALVSSTASSAPWYLALGTALISVFFTYGGYQSTINIGADVERPATTFPRGIISAMLIVLLLYGCANRAYLNVLGFETMKTSPLVAAALATELFGENGMRVTALIIVVSVIGFLNSGLICLPQTMTAMAEDGMLPSYFSRVTHGDGVSSRTLTVFTVLMLIQYLALGTFQRLLNYVMFTDSLSLAFGAACVFVLARGKDSSDSVPTRILNTLAPLLFIAIMLVVTVNVTMAEPMNAIAGIVVFSAGSAAFLLRRRWILKGKKV
ncbi:MAG: APC family permease [Candidatus Kapaibacterium sp.]